ncbi:type I-E CRISPR-associated protein Cse1/CasA [Streptomyces sp. NPDC058067]|uniref:type I-E CRISPR-associated protein Cse1/CasA n=1 Tax=Streptomyces sp. NPDC058067 TaxID=3346324 RepID=UPI0036ED6CAF
MDQQPSFNLVSEPWASALRADDACLDSPGPTSMGLRQLLLEAQDIRALAVGPAPALSALYRILYAVTARVTGLDEAPDGPDEWLDRRAELLETGADAEAVDAYFARYPGRFDLFGSRPFLQDPRLAEQCPKPAGVNKLVLGRPAGNNSSWFGHHFDDEPAPLPAAEAISHLLMWLYYGPSGRCATRTVGRTSEANSSAGPLRSSLSFHPEGSNLWISLLAGLTPPESSVRREVDQCPWEAADLSDPLAPASPYPGPLSRLTGGWQHALLLVPEASGRQVTDAYITWGHRGKKPLTRDAYVIWQLSQQGNYYARPADSGRALWRDVDALLLKEPSGSTHVEPPAVFATAADVADEDLGVRALGFEQDGKTKDVQFITASTPPLLHLMEERRPEIARSIGDLRVAGELYGRRLNTAVRRAWAVINDAKVADCAWGEHAAAHYWPRAEETFWQRVRSEGFSGGWRDFRRLAEETYDLVTEGLSRTGRGARAIEHCRLELYGGRRTKNTKGNTSGPAATAPEADQLAD